MNKVINNANNQKKNFFLSFDNSSKKKIFCCLLLLGIVGFSLRIFYSPFDIPILADSQGYFWYALDMSVLDAFPREHVVFNNGWPSFVSIFFNFIDDENFLVYQNLQRLVGLTISSLTFIPVYALCRKFVSKTYALVACSIFIFEPKLIINSVLGTPESVYIFTIAIMLWLFFSDKIRNIYISFFILGLISLIRYEGLLLVIPISIMYFVRYRKQKNNLFKYLICIGIFILIIFPLANIRSETMGNDGLISHVSAGPKYLEQSVEQNKFSYQDFIQNSIINLIKFLGWSQIPIFIFFVPIGIILIFKKIDYKIVTLFLISITILIPAFYAYGRGFEENKYLLGLYPIFAIFSAYSIQKLYEKINLNRVLLTIAILTFFIISSIAYVDWKSIDFEHEKDAFQIMMDISKYDMHVNMDMGKNGHEFAYIHWSKIYENSEFPDVKKSFVFQKNLKFDAKPTNLEEIKDESIDDVTKFFMVNKKNEKTHLLVDNYNNGLDKTNQNILKEIFSNEEKFPFLEKIYDSKENGYEYHVKLFKINYNLFENEN